MNYHDLTEKIKIITIKIEEKDKWAVKLFDEYLDLVISIWWFHSENIWDINWRLAIYAFWEKFSSIGWCDATLYLTCLSNKNWQDNELLSFIYSEILWNFFNHDSDFVKESLKDLIKKYPWNPEFYHSYWHYLSQKWDYEKAILNYQKAVSLDISNHLYDSHLFNEWHTYATTKLIKWKIEDAERIKNEIMNYYSKKKDKWVFNNMAFALGQRIEDHKLIKVKIDGINDLVDKRIEWVRAHLINVISILTAIIWYLLTWVTFSLDANSTKESLFLLIWTGLVVILFVLIVSYQFRVRRQENFFSFLKHRDFWLIILILVWLIFLYKSQ